jgi:hypothetical protein
VIIRVQNGKSFKGAGLYFLHDKRKEGELERLTTERVAWTYAVNTLEEDPARVLAEMRRTCFDQQYLKMTSGNRLDGSRTQKPVFTVALSWSPDEPAPGKQQMIEGGHSYLQHMGWEAHQALFVCHTDTKHPHLHLIINAVHPETGMTMDANWYKTRSSRWGLAYERENGKVLCLAREARHGRAATADGPVLHYGQWKTWEQLRKDADREPEYTRALQSGEWSALKAGQRAERMAFWKETGEMRHQLRAAIRDEVRAEFGPDWQAYTLQRDERKKAAQTFDRETRHALRHYRAHGPLHGLTSVKEIKERQDAYHTQLKEELAEQRAGIYARMKERTAELVAPALDKLAEDRKAPYQQLLARGRGEKATLTADQAQGVRRQDTLSGYDPANQNRPGALSVVQIKAYKEHAIKVAAEHKAFADARGELAPEQSRPRADPRPRDDEAERNARREQTGRAQEQTDAKTAQQARRRMTVDEYLATRKVKREQERERGGGGRER